MEIKLNFWEVFQDVHDLGEKLSVFSGGITQNNYSHLMSPWERIDRLTYLQLLFARSPYYGRELRSFNMAPWWYRSSFQLDKVDGVYRIRFSMADYYAKVWVNGVYCGFHEGYQTGFSFDITHLVKGGINSVYVKVWSPWDEEIDPDSEDKRFFSVRRRMVKGTYEHADGLIQRDVNPIGLVGPVTVELLPEAHLEKLQVWCLSAKEGRLAMKARFFGSVPVVVELRDSDGKLCLQDYFEGSGSVYKEYVLPEHENWSTWDHTDARLYTLAVIPENPSQEGLSKRFGFADMAMDRTKDHTFFLLNGERVFLRGTTYFPDVYFAALSPERIKRDLLLIRQAGFNAIRVHVHVELDCFYEYCDELGLLVFQDTDFSWNHPTEEAWVESALYLFAEIVERLKGHVCLGCWILLNEPDKWKTSIVSNSGCSLEEIISRPDSISKAIGEQLVTAIQRIDPSRPYIRASYNEDDLESGDSHNYLGSLRGQQTQYTDIAGTKEKLVTEFGMDSPGCRENLAKEPTVLKTGGFTDDHLATLQYYQYKLLKYYIEHYRVQKYQPCSGYFQFMFIDLCPQSFYGVMDWWGTLKESWNALEESNKPIAIMARKGEEESAEGFDLFIANDTCQPVSGTIFWTFMEGNRCLMQGEVNAVAAADETTFVCHVAAHPSVTEHTRLILSLRSGDTLIAKNHYKAPFVECRHVDGHPFAINNEVGMRLFA